MTMRITIKNEDAGRTAEVKAEEFKIGETAPLSTDTTSLGPGESREWWIHSSKRLVITENPNATIPKP